MTKLHLGCGATYKEGFINIDQNKLVKADYYCDLNSGLPFVADNSVDYILMDNSMEHIGPGPMLLLFLEELHRVCVNGATIEIFVPHCTAPSAFKHLTHYHYFGIGSFGICTPETPRAGERYTRCRFRVVTEELQYLVRGSQNFSAFYNLTRPLNWLVNSFGIHWQMICEKYFPGGFEEIHYLLEVVKL